MGESRRKDPLEPPQNKDSMHPRLLVLVLDGSTTMGIATFLTVCILLISRQKRSAMRLEDTWPMCLMATRTISSSPSSTSSTPRMGLTIGLVEWISTGTRDFIG